MEGSCVPVGSRLRLHRPVFRGRCPRRPPTTPTVVGLLLGGCTKNVEKKVWFYCFDKVRTPGPLGYANRFELLLRSACYDSRPTLAASGSAPSRLRRERRAVPRHQSTPTASMPTSPVGPTRWTPVRLRAGVGPCSRRVWARLPPIELRDSVALTGSTTHSGTSGHSTGPDLVTVARARRVTRSTTRSSQNIDLGRIDPPLASGSGTSPARSLAASRHRLPLVINGNTVAGLLRARVPTSPPRRWRECSTPAWFALGGQPRTGSYCIPAHPGNRRQDHASAGDIGDSGHPHQVDYPVTEHRARLPAARSARSCNVGSLWRNLRHGDRPDGDPGHFSGRQRASTRIRLRD